MGCSSISLLCYEGVLVAHKTAIQSVDPQSPKTHPTHTC
jgi:hypothetical protein